MYMYIYNYVCICMFWHTHIERYASNTGVFPNSSPSSPHAGHMIWYTYLIRLFNTYMYIYICIYIYTYMLTCRFPFCMFIRIYMYICICVYICMYEERERRIPCLFIYLYHLLPVAYCHMEAASLDRFVLLSLVQQWAHTPCAFLIRLDMHRVHTVALLRCVKGVWAMLNLCDGWRSSTCSLYWTRLRTTVF